MLDEFRVLRGNHCQCMACMEYFNSVAAFDKHRQQPRKEIRRCLTAPEMTAKGMSLNSGGFWITAARPVGRLAVILGAAIPA